MTTGHGSSGQSDRLTIRLHAARVADGGTAPLEIRWLREHRGEDFFLGRCRERGHTVVRGAIRGRQKDASLGAVVASDRECRRGCEWVECSWRDSATQTKNTNFTNSSWHGAWAGFARHGLRVVGRRGLRLRWPRDCKRGCIAVLHCLGPLGRRACCRSGPSGAITGYLGAVRRAPGGRYGRAVARAVSRYRGQKLAATTVGAIVGGVDGALFLAVIGPWSDCSRAMAAPRPDRPSCSTPLAAESARGRGPDPGCLAHGFVWAGLHGVGVFFLMSVGGLLGWKWLGVNGPWYGLLAAGWACSA